MTIQNVIVEPAQFVAVFDAYETNVGYHQISREGFLLWLKTEYKCIQHRYQARRKRKINPCHIFYFDDKESAVEFKLKVL